MISSVDAAGRPVAGDGPQARVVDQPYRARELTVLERAHLTEKMIRVVLGGSDLADVTSPAPDDHVKLVLPDPDTGAVRPPVWSADRTSLDWPRPFPPTREYTIRHHDPVAGRITIDVVVHPGGLASAWAERALPGDRLWVAGPRSSVVVPPSFGVQVLLGDLTALPAIGRWLEELSASTRAVAIIEVPDASERQPLVERDDIEVSWLCQDDPAHPVGALGETLAGLELPPDQHVYLWAAGEAAAMKPIRRWARRHGFDRRTCDIAGYWRRGFTDSA